MHPHLPCSNRPQGMVTIKNEARSLKKLSYPLQIMGASPCFLVKFVMTRAPEAQECDFTPGGVKCDEKKSSGIL